MAITNADGIVTPDEENTLDPEVYLAAMADSISEGIGVRLAKQESVAGIKSATPVGPYDIAGDANIPALTILTGIGFIENMSLSGGIVTVEVAGLYLITGVVTARFEDGVPIDANLWVNGQNEASQPFLTSLTSYTSTTMVVPAFLAVGDTFYLTVGVGADRTETVTISYVNLNAQMLYAT